MGFFIFFCVNSLDVCHGRVHPGEGALLPVPLCAHGPVAAVDLQIGG